jgi:hypothetical protein
MAAVVLVATVATARASTPVAPTSIGFDISFPQCAEALPPSPGFGVVGVNGGSTFTANKCLARELAWAQGAANPAPAFYANTDNPGPANTSNWPTGQQTPKVCAGANSFACSYDYGWNAARLAFANAVNAENANGSSSPTSDARTAPWWLDVETGNMWESIEYGRSVATGTYDEASIEGMLASFENIGITSVGVYSTSQQWKVITGGSQSTVPPVPVWIPGFGSVASAEVGCGSASFTGGRVAMIQYGSLGYDGDYLCGLLNTPTLTSTSVANSATFSNQIVSTNNAGAVSYVQTIGSPQLVVSASGLVTTSGTLIPGSYVTTGTTSDPSGDTGTFSLTLEVGALIQSVPTTASVKASGSTTYSDQLSVTGGDGAVTYVQTRGTPRLIVSASGLVTTSGALTAGSYVATGTTSDPSGDFGKFSITLVVTTPLIVPAATSITGHAVAGRTVTLTIHGTGFYGNPRVTSHAGTTAVLTRVTGQVLIVRVNVRARSRNGVFTFTITLADGLSCQIRYNQR